MNKYLFPNVRLIAFGAPANDYRPPDDGIKCDQSDESRRGSSLRFPGPACLSSRFLYTDPGLGRLTVNFLGHGSDSPEIHRAYQF